MPRNGSGVYSLPAGNPVVPGTTIDTSWANSTMEDLGNELTNSLSRTGAGGMLGPLRLTDGTITAPSLAFTSETNTGLYRSGAASAWMAVLGANIAQFSSTGVVIASGKALTVQGNATVGGTFGVTGAATLSSTLSVTGAITATGGVLGNVTAASGTSTFNNVTINGDLDMNAGSSGTITNLPNPTNSGDAANKAYVDAQDALRLALTGGTMTGAIAMSNQKITGVGTPSADGDAANKAYVDSVAQGLDIKASVRAATTGNITLSGTQTIDGVSIGVGDRVLVKDQSTAAQNGIYVAASSSWSRSSDADTWAELVGAFVFVEDGTTNDNSGWVCTVAPGGTLGSTAVTWEQFSGAGQINAGTGMTKTGNTLNVNTASSSRIVVGADEIDLATTGVTASTYKSVTVDAYGRVTAGTNPTTLAGFGIGDAYTQTQVDNLLAAKLSLSGGTMTGAIAMGTYKITGLGDPTLAQDAATKNYIDTIFGSTTSAAASAAAAASSASAASTSASNASTSASNASTSATNAASSASSALSYLNTFRGQYLGASATNPTVDGNGNALTAGDLYFNTTSSEMRVYTGSAWAAAYIPGVSAATPTTLGTVYGSTNVSQRTAIGFEALNAASGTYNQAFGYQAGRSTTGDQNSFFGWVSGYTNTTGANNAAFGNASLYTNSTGSNNSAFGQGALQSNTTASNSTAIGYRALNTSTGQGNIAIGKDAALNLTTGTSNIALGWNALSNAAVTGIDNIAIGSYDVSTNWDGPLLSVTSGSSNIAVGGGALQFLTTGANNVAIGNRSMLRLTTASNNTALGFRALGETNTGANNVAVGYQALLGVSGNSHSNNVAVGYQALLSNTTGAGSVAVGYQAGNANQTNSYFVAIGYQAALNNKADDSVYIGAFAGQANTTGAFNHAVGFAALYPNTTGSYNTAFGYASLRLNTTGSNNVAVGHQALNQSTTANNNTAIGYQALYNNTTAISNTAVGYQAGYTSNATAAPSNVGANVFIGSSAGYSATSAIHSVIIGAGAGYNVNTGSSNTLVGRIAGYNLTSGTFNTFVGPGDNNGGSGAFVSTGGKNTILGAYNGNQDGLDIRTASNYAVISDGDGNRLLSTANGYSLALDGGAVPQSGTGITFPATQSASSDANTLDDYEEGDWTPSIGGNATYGGDRGGRYVKVGKIVTVWGKIQITTKGTGSATTISGLPFTSANLGLESSGSTTYYNSLAVNVITPQAYVATNSTSVQFYSATSAGTTIGSTSSIFGDGSRIYFTVTYETST